jgi:hypothetical protein
MSMNNAALTSGSVIARSAPRSVIIAAPPQGTRAGSSADERKLADQYAGLAHSCLGDESPGPNQYAEFTHSYF